MRDPDSKRAWDAENVVQVKVRVNRNVNPELYRIISDADSRSGLARELMLLGLEAKKKGSK